MNEAVNNLVQSLREELIQYGELLSLLEQQQEMIISRSAEGLMQNLAAIHAHVAKVATLRQTRDQNRRALAKELGKPEDMTFRDMAEEIPTDYRPLLEALVDEVNGLLTRANQRLRQNHLLLSRSLEFMQDLMQSLFPTQAGQTYDQSGQVSSGFITQKSTYDTLI